MLQGSPDVFAHTLQFTGDADNLRGGEKVTFVARCSKGVVTCAGIF